MKKYFLIFATVFFAGLWSCEEEPVTPGGDEPAEPATATVGIAAAESTEVSYDFVTAKNDVYTVNVEAVLGEGFEGDIEVALAAGEDATLETKYYTVAPATATIVDGKASFKVSFTSAPADGTYTLPLTLTYAGDNERVTVNPEADNVTLTLSVEKPIPSLKDEKIKFTLGSGSQREWAEGDLIKIYCLSRTESGGTSLSSSTYEVTDPATGALSNQFGSTAMKWKNDEEHTFYAVYRPERVSSMTVGKDGRTTLPINIHHTYTLTSNGSGYTGEMDAESAKYMSYMSATASCDPRDVVDEETGEGSVVLTFSPIMTTLDIEIEGPSDARITAVTVTVETTSETAWKNHEFVFDIGKGAMVDADKAPAADNKHRVSTLLSLVNSDSNNPNSVQLSSGQSLKLTCLIPPIATDNNRTITIHPHTAGTTQVVHKAGAGTSSPIVPGTGNTVKVSYSSAEKLPSNAWMTFIDDNVAVSQLSIPGTHDAATSSFSSSWYKTQSLTIDKQLEMGIRMFDLRPGTDGKIYHGNNSTGVTMENAMTFFGNYLDANPGEAIIAVMRFESDSGGSDSEFITYMQNFLSGNSVYQARKAAFKPSMTLGEARGKILLISRTNLSPNSTYETAYTGWDSSSSPSARTIQGTGGSTTIHIQDMYSRDQSSSSSDSGYLSEKKTLVKNMMNIAANASSGTWFINHCSGYTGSFLSMSYTNNAKNIHPDAYNYLTGTEKPVGPTGMIMMDFAGGSNTIYDVLLPQAVIDNNFKY